MTQSALQKQHLTFRDPQELEILPIKAIKGPNILHVCMISGVIEIFNSYTW